MLSPTLSECLLLSSSFMFYLPYVPTHFYVPSCLTCFTYKNTNITCFTNCSCLSRLMCLLLLALCSLRLLHAWYVFVVLPALVPYMTLRAIHMRTFTLMHVLVTRYNLLSHVFWVSPGFCIPHFPTSYMFSYVMSLKWLTCFKFLIHPTA